MIILSIILTILLAASIYYNFFLIKKLKYISENLFQLLERVEEFSEHMEKVYNYPVFYGDSTLQTLLKHSKDTVEEIKDFADIFDAEEEEGEHDETW